MRLETTKDIIIHSKKFHKLLAEYYHHQVITLDKSRLKILLEYLEERENNLKNTFSEIELTTSTKILNSWFSNSECHEKFGELWVLIESGVLSTDGVIEQFLEIDDCLIRLYKSFAESAQITSVKEFFNNLVKLEENHQIKALKNAAQIDDL